MVYAVTFRQVYLTPSIWLAKIPNPDPERFKANSPGLAVFTCLVLPSTNLFSPGGLRAMRDEVAGQGGFDLLRTQPWRAQAAFNFPLLRRALVDGWLCWRDIDLQPEDSAAFLRDNRFPPISRDKWDFILTFTPSWSGPSSQRFNVRTIQSDNLTVLRLLRDVNCIDLVNRQKLITLIAAVQVLSATPSPGQPPIRNWRDARGLFLTPGYPALQDTYFSLAALEILGGLDRIDREQCIRGILRRHQGKGYFASPDFGGLNEYHIEGDARDTIAAFESLRILGALDRVKDLDRWQFRPQRRGAGKGQVTWNDVEAWVCQRRLERDLRERNENPHAPSRSLLQE